MPQDERSAVLSPTDQWAVLGSQTALYMQDVAKDAYRRGKLGMIGNVDTYSSQNIATHTTGDTSSSGTPLTNGSAGANSTTWAANKNSGIGSLITDGWTAAKALKEGDVFTIATVFAVNPVTKVTLPYLQQFVVRADAVADGTGNMTISISPPIITSGAFQTVSNGPADNTALTLMGTAGTGYRQNLVFDQNAFSLVMVPMVKPPGAVDVARKSYKGYSVRVIPYYDGVERRQQLAPRCALRRQDCRCRVSPRGCRARNDAACQTRTAGRQCPAVCPDEISSPSFSVAVRSRASSSRRDVKPKGLCAAVFAVEPGLVVGNSLPAFRHPLEALLIRRVRRGLRQLGAILGVVSELFSLLHVPSPAEK